MLCNCHQLPNIGLTKRSYSLKIKNLEINRQKPIGNVSSQIITGMEPRKSEIAIDYNRNLIFPMVTCFTSFIVAVIIAVTEDPTIDLPW